jgi:hypothetical protein
VAGALVVGVVKLIGWVRGAAAAERS